MTVGQISEKLELKAVTVCDADRTAEGVYIGDLLSWVMGRASTDDVWITIMSNINIVAVAALADVACIILAEDVEVDEDVKLTAKEKGINIFTSSKTAYELATELSALI